MPRLIPSVVVSVTMAVFAATLTQAQQPAATQPVTTVVRAARMIDP